MLLTAMMAITVMEGRRVHTTDTLPLCHVTLAAFLPLAEMKMKMMKMKTLGVHDGIEMCIFTWRLLMELLRLLVCRT